MDSKQDDWIVDGLVMVKYPKGDIIGMFFGYYSLLVYNIQAVYITLFLWNRDMVTFYCCFTHLLSEIANYILKHMLKHPRPENGAPSGGLFEGRYGMPSQHCHCFAYLVTMVLLLVFHYYRHQISSTKKGIVLFVSAAGLALQVLARIYLKFHTVNQCLVGLAFGVLSALTFYTVGLHLLLPHADKVCRLWFMRMFSFRRDLLAMPPMSPGSSHATTNERHPLAHSDLYSSKEASMIIRAESEWFAHYCSINFVFTTSSWNGRTSKLSLSWLHNSNGYGDNRRRNNSDNNIDYKAYYVDT